MGFTPSKAEGDIWMRQNNNLFEYIAVYVDDPKDPAEVVKILIDKHKFKLKGVGSFRMRILSLQIQNTVLWPKEIHYQVDGTL
jgi:hypothetical protein